MEGITVSRHTPAGIFPAASRLARLGFRQIWLEIQCFVDIALCGPPGRKNRRLCIGFFGRAVVIAATDGRWTLWENTAHFHGLAGFARLETRLPIFKCFDDINCLRGRDVYRVNSVPSSGCFVRTPQRRRAAHSVA